MNGSCPTGEMGGSNCMLDSASSMHCLVCKENPCSGAVVLAWRALEELWRLGEGTAVE